MPEHIIWSIIRKRQEWFRMAERKGVRYACRYFGISAKTYYKWWKRYQESNQDPQSLKDRSRRPKTHPKTSSGKVVTMTLLLRKQTGFGPRRLQYYLKRDFGLTISVCGIYKILNRAGLIQRFNRKKKKYQSYAQYIYYPGHKVQMDVKYVPKKIGKYQHRLYQYSAKDLYTKLRFIRIYNALTPQNTVDFTKRLVKFFPFKIKRIQTDHGMEFTYDFLGAHKIHPLDQLCAQLNISHVLSPVATPRYNGQVERGHRTDMEEFYRRADFNDISQLSQKFLRYLKYYNQSRPHMALNMLSPLQKLHSFKRFSHSNLNYGVYL